VSSRGLARQLAQEVGIELALSAAAPALNPAIIAVARGRGGVRDARDIARGAEGLVNAGYREPGSHDLAYGLGHAVMGGEWFHGGSDRSNALAQLGIDWHAFANDLKAPTVSATDATWIAADVQPAIDEWAKFVQRMAASPVASYVTEWSVFESWSDRLRQLRALARARGILLTSAEPVPLPQTVWQRGASGTGSSLDAWITAGKTLVFGAIAITGVIGFYSLGRDVHGFIKRRRHQ
jgi:hypothetical protein